MQKTATSSLVKFAAIVALAVASLTACAPANKIDLSTVAAVIDVRTPEEFAAGHLQGAVNMNVEGAEWLIQVESLDKAADYVIYCHSGRRAGLAIDYMTQDGFTGALTNAGGIADATNSLGLPIVTG